MKIVHANSLPLETKKSSGRVGSYSRRVVLRGQAGSPGNFSLIIYYQDGSFASPRHRHNFDQFRYQIEGEDDFDRNGKMTPGMLGYFPEGAYYGPQGGPPHTVAVLQFGGPSGTGYLSPEQSREAHEVLKMMGVFEGGFFRRNGGVPGKKNQDSYEAVWEQVHKRPLVYPKPQYTGPIMIDSNQCPWMPLDSVAGVEEKPLGTFTNCKFRAARYKVHPRAVFPATGRGIYMLLSGSGSIGDSNFEPITTVYLDDGEEAKFTADTVADILLMGMPSVALMNVAARLAEPEPATAV